MAKRVAPKKLKICSPFEVCSSVVSSAEDVEAILSVLSSVSKKDVVFGVNEVNRGIANRQFKAVVLSVKNHPAVLTKHVEVCVCELSVVLLLCLSCISFICCSLGSVCVVSMSSL